MPVVQTFLLDYASICMACHPSLFGAFHFPMGCDCVCNEHLLYVYLHSPMSCMPVAAHHTHLRELASAQDMHCMMFVHVFYLYALKLCRKPKATLMSLDELGLLLDFPSDVPLHTTP